MFNVPVILANIYTPNWDNVEFFRELLSLLHELNNHQLILGGDFICVLQPTLDRSRPTSRMMDNSAQYMNSFLQAYWIVDPWTLKDPNSRQYSFFSPAHQSYLRIDFLLLPLVNSCDFEEIFISDHSAVVLSLCFPDNEYSCCQMRSLFHFHPIKYITSWRLMIYLTPVRVIFGKP